MEWAQLRFGQVLQVAGSSFAAPSVLAMAIRAHQYEGWFSELAYPVVNKAVLMASTQDANNDGAVGVSSTAWFPQEDANHNPIDAKDGAGQISGSGIKQILDNNQYHSNDLYDSYFASCGTGCREYVGPTITVPANAHTRVALAWQSCMIEEGGTPAINNDLDLVLDCGTQPFACYGVYTSNSVTSELEMVRRPGCPSDKTCTIKVRIKNGATLNACGSTDYERIGIAWAYTYY
jgi:hypothetical protein